MNLRDLLRRRAPDRATDATETPAQPATLVPPVYPQAIRPVWFLDVDGVLSPYGEFGSGYEFLYPRRGQATGGYVPYRRAVVGRISEMSRSGLVDVHWLSTWESEELDVWQRGGLGPFTEGDRDAEGPFSWWKANTVLAYLAANPGRRVVWTDDDIDVNPHRGTRIREAGGSRLLALCPDRAAGLTDHDLDEIESFLRNDR